MLGFVILIGTVVNNAILIVHQSLVHIRGEGQAPPEAVRSALGVPNVLLENDANAAALAEWRWGAGRGVQNLLFLTMSTGVGGGLILDGRLYRGAHFQAGEVGHIPIEPGGRLCGCGMRGCLEAYTGGANLAARMREDLEAGEVTRIRELAGDDPSRVTPRHWVAALRDGDAYALRLRDEFLDRLSQGLAMLVMSLDPERIVLGTIIRENTDLFLDELRGPHARPRLESRCVASRSWPASSAPSSPPAPPCPSRSRPGRGARQPSQVGASSQKALDRFWRRACPGCCSSAASARLAACMTACRGYPTRRAHDVSSMRDRRP